MSTQRGSRGLSLLEVVIAVSVFIVLMLSIMSMFQQAQDTSSIVHNQTTVMLEAQRIMHLVQDQLDTTNTITGKGNFTITPTLLPPEPYNYGPPAVPIWKMQFNKLSDTGTLFDVTSSDPLSALPYSADTYAISCQYGESSGTDGIDNDGDFIVDEQKLVLLKNGVQEAVLGDNLKNVHVSYTPTSGVVRPRIHLWFTVERLLYGAVKTTADASAAKQGLGPRVKYLADTYITLSG